MNAVDGARELTVSAWIKWGESAGGLTAAREFHRKGLVYAFGGGWGASKARFWINDGAWKNSGDSTTSIDDGNWHHVVGILDGSDLKIFVNGVQENSNNVGAVTLRSTTLSLVIGRCPSGDACGGFEGWNGVLDNVTVLTTARSGAWIKTEYNNQSGRENFLTFAEAETQEASAFDEALAGTTAGTASTSLLSSPMIQAINQLYRAAYDRGPTFAEWKLWAERVIAGDEGTFPELLGAMQWQALFGT